MGRGGNSGMATFVTLVGGVPDDETSSLLSSEKKLSSEGRSLVSLIYMCVFFLCALSITVYGSEKQTQTRHAECLHYIVFVVYIFRREGNDD